MSIELNLATDDAYGRFPWPNETVEFWFTPVLGAGGERLLPFRFVQWIRVFPLNLRMRMSSIMRCRNGETVGVNELMVQLQSKSEADCLTRQLGRTSNPTNNHGCVAAGTARAV